MHQRCCGVATSILAGTIVLAPAVPIAQSAPALDEVLERLGTYVNQYEQELSSIAAAERYEQTYKFRMTPAARRDTTNKRVIESDFVFLRLPGGLTWYGFRNTFIVDGKSVRDSGVRLMQVLAAGEGGAMNEAVSLNEESAAYNLGDLPRTVNAPTVTLGLFGREHRDRFDFRKEGEESVDRRRYWRIAFQERARPTIIRTKEGADQPARGRVLVDPATGSIMKTMLELGGDEVADFVRTRIDVTYRPDAALGFLVPVEMVESCERPGSNSHTPMSLKATATYSDFRRFRERRAG